ncbi:MAG: hypothetical protein ABWX70_14705 [Hyphomicrobium sp.]
MPLYYFSTMNGDRHDDRDDPLDLPNDKAAWSQATMACGEFLKEIDGDLKPNREWRLDVRDEHNDLVFSLKLMPEAFR